jgi:integrase
MKEAKEWAERMDNRSLFGNFAKDFFSRTDENSLRWWNDKKHRTYSPDYYPMKQNVLDNHIMPFFKDVTLEDITPRMIDGWMVSLTSVYPKKRSKGEFCDGSKNIVFRVLSTILDRAVYDGRLQRNPCDSVDCMKYDGGGRQAVSEDDMAKLFPGDIDKESVIWGGLMWLVFFNVARCTGWRPGEISGLKKSDYDPELNGLHTTRTSGKFGVRERIKTTGKGKEYKIGYLDEYTGRALSLYMESTGSDFLFMDGDGRCRYSADSNEAFRRALGNVGIPKDRYTQYCLRHRFMTRVATRLGKDETMELMGHTTWEKVYDHRQAQDKLEQFKGVRDKLKDVV